MRQQRTRPFAALVALGLAGCAGQVRTSGGDVATFYSRSMVTHAASGGAFPLVVHGNPFPGAPPERAAQAVARQMRLPGWFPPARFELAPVTEAPRGDYRLVLIFNPARPVGAREACGDLRGVPLAPPGAEVEARAAFCAGPDAASDAWGSAPTTTPDSPLLRQFLDQLAIAVFPERNRTIEDDEDRFFQFGPRMFRHHD